MTQLWLCGIFLLSGVAALVFENLWFYQCGLAFGNSVWATSLVLAGFMGGLALGNAAAARWGGRVARPVRLYALVELSIGVAGAALVLGLPWLTPLLGRALGAVFEVPWLLQPLRLSLALVLLLVPATAMGATLPLMVSALYRSDPRFGAVLGRLYGWNTLGAVIGALLGDLVLIEHFGVRGTAAIALALDVLAAGGALALARRVERPGRAPEPPPTAAAGGLDGAARRLLWAAALTGGVLLALEVVWFRLLLHFVYGTSTAFAVLLAVVLAGIAAGGRLGGALASRGPAATRHAALGCLLAGLLVLGLFLAFPAGERATTPAQIALPAIALMGPVCLLSGVLFTLIGDALGRRIPDATRAAGWLTLANTTGAAAGSLAGGFLLLPRLGTELGLLALAAAYGGAAALVWSAGPRPESRVGRVATALAALALLGAIALFPLGTLERRLLRTPIDYYARTDHARPVALREGLTETIVYLRREAFGETVSWRMLTNGFSMSATGVYAERYMKLFVYLPVALDPGVRRALLISYGVGSTAKALVDTRALEEIDVVDISRDVLEMNRIVFPEPGEFPLDDPRVRVHVEDGRSFLQTTDRRFDLITGEPPPPKLAAVVSLYTREFFALARARLAPGGRMTYWLPVHSLLPDDTRAIVRAFCDVFPDCTLWAGSGLDWILMGARDGAAAPDADAVAAPWRDPVVRPELVALGLERPEDLGALFIADAETLDRWSAGVEPLTDDAPKRLSDAVAPPAETGRAHLPWMDARASRGRFASSGWVRAFWPAALREATLDAFADREAIDRVLLAGTRRSDRQLAQVDPWITGSRRRTLPLWILGSDADRQRAAKAARAAGRSGPGVEAELGLGALADRDPEAAAAHFRRARELGAPARRWLHFEAYARGLAEDGPGLAALRREIAAGPERSPVDDAVLRWLAARFPDRGAEGDASR